MSGRSLHLRDGALVTNRKTDRRQSPKRPLIERLIDLNEQQRKRLPTKWVPDVRIGFLLPKTLQPFVASGKHGFGINIVRGFVQVTHGSAEECFQSASEFFATVAKQRPPFTVLAVISSSTQPGRAYGRYLTVVNGAMVVCSGYAEPRVYGAAA